MEEGRGGGREWIVCSVYYLVVLGERESERERERERERARES